MAVITSGVQEEIIIAFQCAKRRVPVIGVGTLMRYIVLFDYRFGVC